MIGEHPEIYGFPELHLFVGDTVRDIIDFERGSNKHHAAGPPGLLRTLAQLHDGLQSNATIFRAIGWLNDRRDWTVKRLTDYLLEAVAPRMGLEKSPIITSKPAFLERAYATCPDAFFLHLTRHPVGTRASWKEFVRAKPSGQTAFDGQLDGLIGWHQTHTNIMRLTASLPAGQTMRVKGEDLLSEPDKYLPQIAEWLGLRTDARAIEAMKHPENSPYACAGPDVARGGNDPKFMRSPKLREGRVREASLAGFLAQGMPEWIPAQSQFSEAARRSGMRVAAPERIAGEISELSHCLGYL